jgi:succinyl-CoA synthetase alpha subunit
MNLAPDSKVLIQGIAEPLGALSAARMQAYGTQIVAAVSPGQGGQRLQEIPIFDLVEQALLAVASIDISIIFNPPYSALDAALEAIAAGIRQIILVTNRIPPLDMVFLLRKAATTGTTVLGAGSLGIIIPDKLLLGRQESQFYTPGGVGLISRCGNLVYEVALALNQAGLGQSMSISLGCDAIIASAYETWLPILAADKNTKAIVLISQVGYKGEEELAQYITKKIDKPAIAYFVGRQFLGEKKLADAGTLIAAQMAVPVVDSMAAQQKILAFKEAKIPLAEQPTQIPDLVKKLLKK